MCGFKSKAIASTSEAKKDCFLLKFSRIRIGVIDRAIAMAIKPVNCFADNVSLTGADEMIAENKKFNCRTFNPFRKGFINSKNPITEISWNKTILTSFGNAPNAKYRNIVPAGPDLQARSAYGLPWPASTFPASW